MIIEALWNMIVEVTTTLFSVMPSLPEMPEAIIDGADAILNLGEQAVWFLQYIFSPIFLNAVIGILVALFVFEKGYTMIMFVLKKIPFINLR